MSRYIFNFFKIFLSSTVRAVYTRIGTVIKQWLTADDERVCKICRPLDMETAEMDGVFIDVIHYPLAHNSCRCAIAYEETSDPIVQSLETQNTNILTDSVNNDIIRMQDTFQSAQTFEEAEQYAKNNFGVQYMKKYNVDIANSINEEIENAYKMFGNLNDFKALRFITQNNNMDANVVAQYSYNSGTIFTKSSKKAFNNKTRIKWIQEKILKWLNDALEGFVFYEKF